jgi:hypothetical protein
LGDGLRGASLSNVGGLSRRYRGYRPAGRPVQPAYQDEQHGLSAARQSHRRDRLAGPICKQTLSSAAAPLSCRLFTSVFCTGGSIDLSPHALWHSCRDITGTWAKPEPSCASDSQSAALALTTSLRGLRRRDRGRQPVVGWASRGALTVRLVMGVSFPTVVTVKEAARPAHQPADQFSFPPGDGGMPYSRGSRLRG